VRCGRLWRVRERRLRRTSRRTRRWGPVHGLHPRRHHCLPVHARAPTSSRGAWQHRPAHTAHRWGKRTRRESGPNRNPHGSLSLLSRQLSAIQQTPYARRATAPTPGARQSPRNGPGSAAQRRQLDTAGRGPAPDRAAGQLSSLRGQPAAPPMFTASRGPLLSCSVPRLVGWIGLVSRESGGIAGPQQPPQ
jgi:hypothetical protein